jgi:acetyl esterase/lipase
MKRMPLSFLSLVCFFASPVWAADAPAPTLENIPYGTHERQVLDFYKADSSKPTPLVFYIHGGGWVNGDKSSVRAVNKNYMQCNAEKLLAAKISVVAINYRYTTLAAAADIKPPVKWPLEDAARALQFTRSKAKEWNIDPKKVGAAGGSAGAASSLWLAFHDDMADAKSDDPIARQSTRLQCAGVMGAQTCFDPKLMRDWIPNTKYGGHAYGFQNGATRDSAFDQFYAARDQVMPWVLQYSPYHLVTSDDPPICLEYSRAPGVGDDKDPTHSAVFGVKLAEKLREVGEEVYVVYPGSPDDAKYASAYDFLIAKLKAL